jgi:hypothetical protein
MFMANELAMTPVEGMDSKIHLIRGQRVMLDSDLAAIRKLLEAPAGEKPKREIGFHMQEVAPPYRISSTR